MKQPCGKASSRSRRGIRGGPLVIKRAADARANALAPTLRKLRAAGFVSRQALADELNRRRIPTARGRRWQYTTVLRMLTRLGLLTSGKGGRINNGQESKRAADARAKALASTIRKLQARGLVSSNAIARELNKRKVPTARGGRARGGKWYPTGVKRLLQRLQRLEPARGWGFSHSR
jgi:Recombinase